MLYNFWVFSHNIGLHFYALPTLALALTTGVIILVHIRNQKKRDDDFEDQLKEKLEQDT